MLNKSLIKTILILFLLFLNFAIAKEETPLLLDTPITSINYVEDNSSLINITNMKKQDKLEKAKEYYLRPCFFINEMHF